MKEERRIFEKEMQGLKVPDLDQERARKQDIEAYQMNAGLRGENHFQIALKALVRSQLQNQLKI